ncbi:MAG: carboxypeptidase-like regulatory domain-containing protein, partial [Acidobacteria bacterium]|nr:carboxypeptidase-like regulatory domain-containing protein [Acidobacteriota bacterium]
MSTRTRRLIAKSLGFGVVVVLLLVASIRGFAQSDNSQISGFVKDQNGAIVAGAKVSAKSEVREFERNSTTNAEGYYVIPYLPPGLYTVTVEANGFKQFKASNKKLDPNIATKVDVILEPGAVTETVNITASTATVQTETSTVGKLIEGKQVELLQLNGRNPLYLAALKPGVS